MRMELVSFEHFSLQSWLAKNCPQGNAMISKPSSLYFFSNWLRSLKFSMDNPHLAATLTTRKSFRVPLNFLNSTKRPSASLASKSKKLPLVSPLISSILLLWKQHAVILFATPTTRPISNEPKLNDYKCQEAEWKAKGLVSQGNNLI